MERDGESNITAQQHSGGKNRDKRLNENKCDFKSHGNLQAETHSWSAISMERK